MIIKHLTLYTAQLQKQTDFFSNVLSLNLVDKTNQSASFQIGQSILKFEYKDEVKPYHFAINIPANKASEALAWLKSRVDIIKDEDNEIIDFEDWNADAVYFYGPENNILELIARKNLDNKSNKVFDENLMLEISEIGIPTFDISKEYNLLKETTGLPIHSGSMRRFCSAGDDNGLFIIINRDLKKFWFPTEDIPYSADFKISFVEQDVEYSFTYDNEILKQD